MHITWKCTLNICWIDRFHLLSQITELNLLFNNTFFFLFYLVTVSGNNKNLQKIMDLSTIGMFHQDDGLMQSEHHNFSQGKLYND